MRLKSNLKKPQKNTMKLWFKSEPLVVPIPTAEGLEKKIRAAFVKAARAL
jgi:hypothetical protein